MQNAYNLMSATNHSGKVYTLIQLSMQKKSLAIWLIKASLVSANLL